MLLVTEAALLFLGSPRNSPSHTQGPAHNNGCVGTFHVQVILGPPTILGLVVPQQLLYKQDLRSVKGGGGSGAGNVPP